MSRYGRKKLADPRDSDYPFRRVKPVRQYRNWSLDWVGDQQDEPSCVGFGWSHFLRSSPFRQFLDPSGVYEIAKHYDDFRGTRYDGTTVRAGAKVLQMLGFVDTYHWTSSAKTAARHVLEVSPVVIGVDWYAGMEEPNDAGIVSLDGDLYGAHCVCLVGYNSRTEMFRFVNSFGDQWGRKGYGYLSLSDLQTLLDAEGECCVGYERSGKNPR